MCPAARGNARDACALAGMNCHEEGFSIACAGDELVGVLAVPESPARVGVLVVVGGPQYRVGSHRQFVLLARALARSGYAAMRFDYRGMGDASGSARSFEHVSEDIDAALRAFAVRCPSIEGFVLWGLCDAASASLLYLQATRDSRVSGVVLLNPWVRSDRSLAQAQVRHYYARRLAEPEFWGRLLRGQLPVRAAARSLVCNLQAALGGGAGARNVGSHEPSYQDRMADGLDGFRGPVLVVLSERDLTAQEFSEFVKSDRRWAELVVRPNVRQVRMAEPDHTFSSAAWREAVEKLTAQWIDEAVAPRGAAT